MTLIQPSSPAIGCDNKLFAHGDDQFDLNRDATGQFRHADGRSTTVPFHAGRDLSSILLRQIAKDIGLTVDDLLKHR